MGPLLTSISTLTFTITATADVKAKQLVGFDGAPAGAGDPVMGIAQYDANAGDAFAVDAIGVFDLIAGAAIAKGAELQSDAAAKPVTLSGGSGFARALTAAANPGDIVKVLIK